MFTLEESRLLRRMLRVVWWLLMAALAAGAGYLLYRIFRP